MRFLLPSIIITITSNEPWNTETHKTDRNPPITNHKPWPFEPVKVKFCFLRGPLRWLTAAKNAIVSWLLNFTIRMFVRSAVKSLHLIFIMYIIMSETVIKIDSLQLLEISRQTYPSSRSKIRATAFTVLTLCSFFQINADKHISMTNTFHGRSVWVLSMFYIQKMR